MQLEEVKQKMEDIREESMKQTLNYFHQFEQEKMVMDQKIKGLQANLENVD